MREDTRRVFDAITKIPDIAKFILVGGTAMSIQTLPDAILSWIGGRSDDAVGVGEHSEKAHGMLIAGFGNAKGAVGQAMAPAKGKEGESEADADKQAKNDKLMQKSSNPT